MVTRHLATEVPATEMIAPRLEFACTAFMKLGDDVDHRSCVDVGFSDHNIYAYTIPSLGVLDFAVALLLLISRLATLGLQPSWHL
jgi:hypothetical protein